MTTRPRPWCGSTRCARPLYAEVADLVIDVDDLPAEEVGRRILAAAADGTTAPGPAAPAASTTE